MAESASILRRAAWAGIARLPKPARELAYIQVRRTADAELRALTSFPAAERRLYIGPRNTAGQGWEWARAVDRHVSGAAAQCLWAESPSTQANFHYRADHSISVRAQRGHVREIHGGRVLREATHVLFESGLPVLSDFHLGSTLDDVPALESAGIRHALLLHGSEIRDLSRHGQLYPHSPFGTSESAWDGYFHTLQSIVDRNRRDLESYPGPVMVTTLDLLDFLPTATWLPIVIDVGRFTASMVAGAGSPLERGRPVVLHAPSNPLLKGSAVIESAMLRLQQCGLVEYRRLSGISHEGMATAVADADIVIDQILLGNLGVLAAESMAAGRVVVGHLHPDVRARLSAADLALGGSGEVPIVEADPTTIEAVLRQMLEERAAFRQLAAAGPAWAARHHDGRRSAAVLDEVLLSG